MAKQALIRLEDVGPSQVYTDSENLLKLRAIADYLESQGIAFQVAVVPHAMDPPNNYSKSIADTKDPDVAAFNETMQYFTEHGGTLHMKGYTNQYSLASTGYEFSSVSCTNNCPPDDDCTAGCNLSLFMRSHASSRLNLGIDAFKRSGLPFSGCFITPKYSASNTQRNIINAWVGVLYENDPDNPAKRTVSIKNTSTPLYQGIVYVPTPLGTVSDTDPESDIQRICNALPTYTGNDLASFCYYPYMEFPFIQVTLSGVVYDDNSYLKQLISCFKQQNFKFINIFDALSFVPSLKQENFGPTSYTKQFFTGDVNADGKTDFIIWEPDLGFWYFMLSGLNNYPVRQTTAFTPVVALTGWAYGGGWNAYAGDFNGDKQTDIAVWSSGFGQWQVALSNGRGLVPSPGKGKGIWLNNWAVGSYWVPFTGDFNGDGKDDLLVWNPYEGGWQVALSNGQYFIPQSPWLNGWAVGKYWVPFVGDFNGDGKDDIVVWNPSQGEWQVALSNGSQFIPKGIWLKSWAKGYSWKPVIADFDGDGRDDILVVLTSLGDWQVAQSTGTKFVANAVPFVPWASDPATVPYAGHFNGDSKASICAYNGTVPYSIINIANSRLNPVI